MVLPLLAKYSEVVSVESFVDDLGRDFVELLAAVKYVLIFEELGEQRPSVDEPLLCFVD